MKIKRNTELIYNGETVFMERDREDGTALIRIGTMFEDVDTCDLKLAVKGRSTISNKPKVLTDSEKSFKKELNVFFADQLLVCPKQCEECQTPFYNYSKDELRGLVAHILPKNKKAFPAVSCHPQNRMFLGTKCGCHSAWDGMGAQERSQMNIYPVAIERFNKFKELLTTPEIIKAEKYLNILQK